MFLRKAGLLQEDISARKGLSLYLDLVRLGAAVLVFLHHFSARQEFSGGFLWQLRGFGSPAVMAFFVLSGFVIYDVSRRPGYSAARFAADRIARIMSVALPAIALTFLLDRIGLYLRPALYTGALDHSHAISTQVAAGLLFLNESWAGHIGVGSNAPYWSLPYEVWYYAAFGAAVYMPAMWRLTAPVLALLVAGPLIAAVFPVWLLGCWVRWLCPRLQLPVWLALAIVMATLFGSLGAGIGMNIAGRVWAEEASGAVFLCLVALGVALNFLSAWHASQVLLKVLHPIAPLIRIAARMTFTLYLVHMPVMFCIRASSPWASDTWASRGLILGGTVLIAAGLTAVTDHIQTSLRSRLRDWFTSLRRPVLPLSTASE